MRRKSKKRLSILLAALVLFVLIKKPSDEGRSGVVIPDDGYFAGLEPLIKQECHGLPCAMIDLDRLDANIRAVKDKIRAPRRIRIVVKSLPSVQLLRYVLEKTGTRRVMIFHAPQIPYLLKELGDLDILIGKPMPAAAAREVLREMPSAAEHVQWLVDTTDRINEYLQVARELRLKLKLNTEIDVGLHRGGARDEGELRAMLGRIRDNPAELSFTGYMGYDGHVSHTPSFFGFGSKERAMRWSFGRVLASYAEFVEWGKAFEPSWFTGPAAANLTLNGGGSHTYAMYDGQETPINDLALGSAFVKPADFEDATLAAHQRAMFLAIPILKKLSSPPIPFMDAFWGLATAWDPNVARGFYIYGAVWDSQIVYPRGLRPGWFYEPEIRNLLPNQSLISGSASIKAEVGDYIWLHPREGDAIAVYRDIIAARGSKAEARWQPLPMLN
jgi:D-serine deaminase-like pyridoxal phosphate-dependent protein